MDLSKLCIILFLQVQLCKVDIAADPVVWEDAGQIEYEEGVNIGPVVTLEAMKFTDNTGDEDGSVLEKVCLYAGR